MQKHFCYFLSWVTSQGYTAWLIRVGIFPTQKTYSSTLSCLGKWLPLEQKWIMERPTGFYYWVEKWGRWDWQQGGYLALTYKDRWATGTLVSWFAWWQLLQQDSALGGYLWVVSQVQLLWEPPVLGGMSEFYTSCERYNHSTMEPCFLARMEWSISRRHQKRTTGPMDGSGTKREHPFHTILT